MLSAGEVPRFTLFSFFTLESFFRCSVNDNQLVAAERKRTQNVYGRLQTHCVRMDTKMSDAIVQEDTRSSGPHFATMKEFSDAARFPVVLA